MSWGIYIFSSIIAGHLIASNFTKNYLSIYFLIIVIFLTPASIDTSSTTYAPSLFSFFYSLVLERDYSLRPLRPLMLSIPLYLLLLIVFAGVKRIFSLKKDLSN